MKFNQENIALLLIGLALVYLYCNSGHDLLSYKNSGKVNVPNRMASTSRKVQIDESQVETHVPLPTTSQSDKLIKGSNGNVLAAVEPGVSTLSIEDRLEQQNAEPGYGVGWDSSALLPKMTADDLNSISPIEFAKGDNFLQPVSQIGSVADSNRNPNMSLRRDPEITPKTVGPWQQSTIYPDPYRKPLDCF